MKILIVGRQPLLRDGLERLLRGRLASATVSAVECFAEACEDLRQLPAGLVVVQLGCCRAVDGQGLSDLVIAAGPGRVVVMGGCCDRTSSRQAQSVGVHGHIPTTAPSELIGAAIELVLAGGIYFPTFASTIIKPTGNEKLRLGERLSPRQSEVLQGLQEGLSNKMIASKLGISVATVKLHVQSIFRHSGARNRAQAVAFSAGILAEQRVMSLAL
jgi:DNA-binding NarL/FixJ family response regulator